MISLSGRYSDNFFYVFLNYHPINKCRNSKAESVNKVHENAKTEC